MDVKMYYQKIREMEATITDPFPVMVSRATRRRRQGAAC